MTFLQPTFRGKLGATKHWLDRAIFRASEEHRALVANTAAADITTFGGLGPADEFRHLLRRIGAGELAERVNWLPYPVPHSFCSRELSTGRLDRIIAIGRWNSPQKNAALLASTVRQLSNRGSRSRIVIIGQGAKERFSVLARQVRNVQVLGVQPRERIRDLMAESRTLLLSSRWEGSPIVANEMLALGGTVVGTPIPSISGLVAETAYGRVSSYHNPHSLAAAVSKESDAWDRGERNPQAIAAYWRPLVSPVGVAQRLLALLSLPIVHRA
ncbi:glycosyltransferase [Humisphaera borealis]|uniref:Glycosyltransferase n=2 Tax=Humisphaera borealis TaxID=2807512 RepID=A0A7M2WYQ6_9BACT|nr:glycosyltransferase [Humisphaera borealis]